MRWGVVLACLSEVAAPGKVAVILRLLCGAARAVPPAPGSLRCRRSGLAVPSSSAGRAGLAVGSGPPPGISPRRSRLWSTSSVPGILARRAAGEPRHVPSRPGRSCSARPGSPAVAAEAFTSARPAFEDTPAGRSGVRGLAPGGSGQRPGADAAVRSQRSSARPGLRTRTPTGRWPPIGRRGRWRDAPGSDERGSRAQPGRPESRALRTQSRQAAPTIRQHQAHTGRPNPARPAFEDGTGNPDWGHRKGMPSPDAAIRAAGSPRTPG